MKIIIMIIYNIAFDILKRKTSLFVYVSHDMIMHRDYLLSFSFILSTAALIVSSSLQKVNLTRFFASSGFK